MRIRLTGTREELDTVLPGLAAVLDVRETSGFYPNRGDSQLGRMYLDVGGIRPDTIRAMALRVDHLPPAIEGRQSGEDRS